MDHLSNYPLLVFAITFAAMCLASLVGLWVHNRLAPASARSQDFDVISAATLSILALIIGFTFSMGASRYEQRKSLEAAEANKIGTEFQRASLLAPSDAARVRELLGAYLDQRIQFFNAADGAALAQINERTDQLDSQLWAAVRGPATAQPTALTALVVAGMNDVLDSRGYTQAALWNRIPAAAWTLMGAIALFSNALLGYGARDAKAWRRLGFVLPFFVSIAFFLIADMDAPRRGVIRVAPENLKSLAQPLMQ